MNNKKADYLRRFILAGGKLSTLEMCVALGWQGGTIHLVASETGLTVSQLIEAQQ